MENAMWLYEVIIINNYEEKVIEQILDNLIG